MKGNTRKAHSNGLMKVGPMMSNDQAKGRRALALIDGGNSELADLLDGLAMNTKQTGDFALAALVDHHCASDFGIKFH